MIVSVLVSECGKEQQKRQTDRKREREKESKKESGKEKLDKLRQKPNKKGIEEIRNGKWINISEEQKEGNASHRSAHVFKQENERDRGGGVGEVEQ